MITEDRCDADEVLGSTKDIDRFPDKKRIDELDPASPQFSDSNAWLRRQVELWLGEEASESSPVELGELLGRHDFLRQILKVLGGSLRSWPEIDSALLPRCARVGGL